MSEKECVPKVNGKLGTHSIFMHICRHDIHELNLKHYD